MVTKTIDTVATYAVQDTSVFVMTKSPWKAVLFSAVLPGTGQIYNKSYWKAPIVWGFAGWFTYNYILNNKSYHDFQRRYQLIPNDDVARQSEKADYKGIRDFYRDQRDVFAVYMGITYVLNLVDAYVDAQLFDFSVDEGGTHKTLSMKFYFNR